MKVQELFEGADLPLFVSYLYKQKEFKKAFSDLAEVEDLFDTAYLEDADPDVLAMEMANSKNVPSLEKIEKELKAALKWAINHMQDKKQWQAAATAHAEVWAKRAAPSVLKLITNKYRD